MKSDILLLRPRGRMTDSRVFAMEQLGLSYIAAMARAAGFTVDIIDGALDPDRYGAALTESKDLDHKLIGYPIYPETIRRVAKDVAGMRARGITTHVTVGNHLATLHDKAVLTDFPQFNSVVRGEGEQTVVALARALSLDAGLSGVQGLTYRQGKEIRRNPPRPNIQDLDAIPFPARDTLPMVLKAGNAPLIYSSRGCNARCDFCSVHNYFNASPSGAWRGRSPANVVDEMEALLRLYGAREFAFADEQFLGHGKSGTTRALEIAEEIRRRRLDIKWYIETRASGVTIDVFARLRDAGLSAVFMGLESGFDPALKQMRKGLTAARSVHAIEVLKELEILPSAGFIMFRPDTTIEELRSNLDFLAQVGCVELTALVTAMRVYSGTALEDRLRSEGRLKGHYYNYEWSFQDAKVGDCYLVAMESADTLSTSYNAFARFRRAGLVSYSECLKLQRAMNSGPLEIMRDVVDGVDQVGRATADLRAHARERFKQCCDDFLRLLRFVEVCAEQRPADSGVRLLSPMYLC
ncbi:B12-binding domain-containing radical SAM protein [Streptomyces sp. NPDC020597]|uniref:B12-binding domain-containing radical SAM protein n=1 Tax=unclassified Streptomyces TaxID=2593676 RepID=UPI0037A28875